MRLPSHRCVLRHRHEAEVETGGGAEAAFRRLGVTPRSVFARIERWHPEYAAETRKAVNAAVLMNAITNGNSALVAAVVSAGLKFADLEVGELC